MQVRKEAFDVGQLVNDPEGKREVDPARKVSSREPLPLGQPSLDPLSETGPSGPPAQSLEHPRLDVHSHDLALISDKTCQLEREEAHATAGLEYGYAGRDEEEEDISGFCHSRRSGEIRKYPSHHGQTHCAIPTTSVSRWAGNCLTSLHCIWASAERGDATVVTPDIPREFQRYGLDHDGTASGACPNDVAGEASPSPPVNTRGARAAVDPSAMRAVKGSSSAPREEANKASSWYTRTTWRPQGDRPGSTSVKEPSPSRTDRGRIRRFSSGYRRGRSRRATWPGKRSSLGEEIPTLCHRPRG